MKAEVMTFKLGALSQGSPSVIVLQCKTQHASVLSIFFYCNSASAPRFRELLPYKVTAAVKLYFRI